MAKAHFPLRLEANLVKQAALSGKQLDRTIIEPVVSPMVYPDGLFSSLEEDRESGRLQENITSSALRYQVSEKHSGLLEKISVDNSITIGQFKNGEFQPVTGAFC